LQLFIYFLSILVLSLSVAGPQVTASSPEKVGVYDS
jgi:hypothetical protein